MSQGKLSGRVAIVTGAARGQGEAIARRFAAEGAEVVLTDVLDEQGEKVAADVGGRYVHLDISRAADWERLLSSMEGSATVDVLVNNAAITHLKPLEETTEDEYRRVFEVNELGIFLGMQAVFPRMRAQGGGSIVNTSSAAAVQGITSMAIYTATKSAVLAITKVAAAEWGRYGIRVNSILPGGIETPMMRGPHTEHVDLEAMFRDNPIPRPGRPDEIASAALFLACEEDSSYVSGLAMLVDGARSAARVVPRLS